MTFSGFFCTGWSQPRCGDAQSSSFFVCLHDMFSDLRKRDAQPASSLRVSGNWHDFSSKDIFFSEGMSDFAED